MAEQENENIPEEHHPANRNKDLARLLQSWIERDDDGYDARAMKALEELDEELAREQSDRYRLSKWLTHGRPHSVGMRSLRTLKEESWL